MKPTDPIIHEYISPDGSVSYGLEFPVLATTASDPLDDIRMKAVMAFVQILMPLLDFNNRALVLEWAGSAVAHHEPFVEEKLSP